MSGYGTFSKQKGAGGESAAEYGIFDTPSNKAGGMVSKTTKQVAEQVDHELMNDEEIMARIIEEER